jgi:hypothetical protein
MQFGQTAVYEQGMKQRTALVSLVGTVRLLSEMPHTTNI